MPKTIVKKEPMDHRFRIESMKRFRGKEATGRMKRLDGRGSSSFKITLPSDLRIGDVVNATEWSHVGKQGVGDLTATKLEKV